MKWTQQELDKLKEQGKIRGYVVIEPKKVIEEEKPKKKSKFGNKRVEYNGEWFDSTRERDRYIILLLLLKHGLIGQLKRQVPFELNTGGTHSLKYVCDFVYLNAETGETIYEDVKGCLTRVYKKKKKLMKRLYGITLLET